MLYALKTCLYTPTGYRPWHRSVSSSPRFPPHPFSCTRSNPSVSFTFFHLFLSIITHHRPIHRLFLYYRIVLLFNDPKVDQPRTVDCTWEFSYRCTRVCSSSSCVCVFVRSLHVCSVCVTSTFSLLPYPMKSKDKKTKQNKKEKRLKEIVFVACNVQYTFFPIRFFKYVIVNVFLFFPHFQQEN